MVKVWMHAQGGTAPQLVTEISLKDCTAEFDLADARFLQPPGERPPSAAAPGPLGADSDPDLVVFEVLPDEQTAQIRAGYYASAMSAATVQELIGEE